MYNKINFYKLNLLIIVIAFFLSIKPSFAYELNVLPKSFCNALYAKLNLGDKDLKKKIEVFTKFYIETVAINERNNSYDVGLEKKYSYYDEDLLKILKENFSEEPLIKNEIGEYSSKYCLFDYDKGISEKKFLDFKRYYGDVISTRKGAVSYIRVYPSGGVRYRIKDEYNKLLEPNFDFRKFPFDQHKLVLAEFTQITNFVEFTRSESTSEHFEEMNKTQEFDVVTPGWKVTEINQYDYFTPKDWNDDQMESSIGSVQVFITLERNSFSYLLKFAFPIIFIVLISWGVFWVDPKDIKTRAELSIISLLSLIAFNFVISDKLPDLNYLTLLDSLVLTSYLFAGAATIISIMVNIYARKKYTKLVAMIDHQARVWGPIVYIIFNIIFGYAVATNPI